jgi:hypothetical protein
LSSAFLSNARFTEQDMILAMRLNEILVRIESRLVALKMSANRAAVLAGKSGAIRNLKRAIKDGDRQGISTATLEALAPVLETTVGWLLTGHDGNQEDTAIDAAVDAKVALADAEKALAWSLVELGSAPETEAPVLARAVLRAIRTPPSPGESPLTDEEKRALVREAIRLYR